MIIRILLLAAALVFGYAESHAIRDLNSCTNNADCNLIPMCSGSRPCECYDFGPEMGMGSRCVRTLWADRLRARDERFVMPSEDDIGPDTCGQDRVKLGKWFMSHGEPSLIQQPRPPVVKFWEDDVYDDSSNPPLQPDQITGYCAMQWQDEVDPETGKKQYLLSNFTTEAEAAEAGWNITHKGHCGACSSLQDLGVYISQNLTDSTRRCGLYGSILGDAYTVNCLKKLGFSKMCSQIWLYNIKHTRKECLAVCMLSYITDEPFNKPDGSLNDCLQCDEDKSGPNFKYFSGRTRRNSGIPSSIYRPPETVYNMTHCYWYGDLSY